MLRHWTNTLVNRDFPRTLGWNVSNSLLYLVNSVPKESGSGVRVCKACGDRMSLSEVVRFCRLSIVKLFLDSTSLVSPYERFLDWRGTVEELDPLGLLSDSWEPIVPDTEKALSVG
jgi:hypothetical protein